MAADEEVNETMEAAVSAEDASAEGDGSSESGAKGIGRGTWGLILLIALGGAGIFVMYKRNGPASASAATPAAANDAAVSQFLQGGKTNIKMMEQMLRRTEEVVNQFRTYPSMAQVPLSDLSKNPFRHEQPKAANNPSGAESAEAKKQREAERQAVLKAVQGLQLGSIMHSEASKACMINNAMYSEGQQVEGFTVEKITPMSVIVRKGAYRFELKIGR